MLCQTQGYTNANRRPAPRRRALEYYSSQPQASVGLELGLGFGSHNILGYEVVLRTSEAHFTIALCYRVFKVSEYILYIYIVVTWYNSNPTAAPETH